MRKPRAPKLMSFFKFTTPLLAVLVLSLVLLWHWIDTNTIYKPPSAVATAGTPTADGGGSVAQLEPPYLAIPKIGVVSAIQDVGVTEEGNMDVPDDPADVGWYKYGSWPGAVGNAVLAGHVDADRGRTAGVFWDLHKLKVGDEVQLVDKDETVLTFRVTDKASYTPEDAPLEKIFGYTSAKKLNLITCEGRWDPVFNTYSHRLVVFTELVE